MKNNILFRFTLEDLKTHRKDTLIALITLTIIALICTLMTAFIPLFANQSIADFRIQHGTYDYYSYHLESLEKLNQMKISINGKVQKLKDADVLYSCIQNKGYVVTDGSIDYIYGNKSIMAIELKSGRMPINDHEIAIQETVLESFGYDKTLHQIVQIPYIGDEKNQVGEWEIVGLLEQTGDTAIVIGEPPSNQNYQVYIDVKDGDKLDNAEKYGLVNTIDKNAYIDMASLNVLVVMLQFVLFIIGCTILFGMTIAAFENRKDDYALLRGIGATKRQLYFIVFIQSLLFIVSSLVIAWTVSSLLIFVFSYIIETVVPIQLRFSHFLGVIVIICLMTLISYFMPARSACYRALTGSFQGSEFQYFYYRYKKLHRMRPLYLGWRQLVSHKKQMIVKIFLIFIASLMMMKIIGDRISILNLLSQKESLNQSHTQEEISLTYAPSREDVTFITTKDLDAYKPYAQDMRYFHVIDYENDARYFGEIYCYDEDVKAEFQIQEDILPGEVIVSERFKEINFDTELENINGNGKIVMSGESYQIVSQIPDDKPYMIMSAKDFQNYGDIEHYQQVKIYFHDIHQKTKGLVAYVQQNSECKYSWVDSLYTAQLNMNMNIEENTQNIPFIEISIMLGTGIIYIYQLSYEILKQRETIGTYQLLGMRKFEIWRIYVYKSGMIALIGFVYAVYYHFADIYLNYGLNNIYFTPTHFWLQLLPSLLFILSLIVLSLLPIYSILRKDGLENKNIRE